MTNRGTAKSTRIHLGPEQAPITLRQKLANHIIAHPNDSNPTIERFLTRALEIESLSKSSTRFSNKKTSEDY